MLIVPDVGSTKPAIMRSVVVLPQPDGPSSETNSPGTMSRSRLSTARKSLNRQESPRSDSRDCAVGVGDRADVHARRSMKSRPTSR